MKDHLPESSTLDQLAVRINSEVEQAESALKAGLVHAKTAGELLLQAKALVKHDVWLPWLRDHSRVSERTAQAYMRVASGWRELEAKAQGLADLTFEDGLKLLAAPKEESKPEIELRGVGVFRAYEAVDCLRRIPKNDGLRARGFQVVEDWIRQNE